MNGAKDIRSYGYKVGSIPCGMTYPDITLLPQLATYFNISIDELMRYEPQMTKEQIRSLYRI